MTKRFVVGPNWVGDMVMAQSFFKYLKNKDPNVQIDVFAPSWTAPLLAFMPEVSVAHVSPLQRGSLSLGRRWQLGRDLITSSYQQAYVLPNAWKAALVPWFAKIPLRTGWHGEQRYGLINDRRHGVGQYQKMVQRYCALALAPGEVLSDDALPTPQLCVDAAQQAHCRQYFQLSDTTGPVTVLAPGAEFGAAKRWPAAHYAQLADQLIASGGQVWLMGSRNDMAVADQVVAQMRHDCSNWVGKTSLTDAVCMLSLADQVVANDSGLMHVAAALNLPTVAIYGPTAPEFAPPLTEHARVMSAHLGCSPCRQRVCPLGHHHCMTTIQPEQVYTALDALRH